jgi:hypothetical protein
VRFDCFVYRRAKIRSFNDLRIVRCACARLENLYDARIEFRIADASDANRAAVLCVERVTRSTRVRVDRRVRAWGKSQMRAAQEKCTRWRREHLAHSFVVDSSVVQRVRCRSSLALSTATSWRASIECIDADEALFASVKQCSDVVQSTWRYVRRCRTRARVTPCRAMRAAPLHGYTYMNV